MLALRENITTMQLPELVSRNGRPFNVYKANIEKRKVVKTESGVGHSDKFAEAVCKEIISMRLVR